MDVDFDFSDVDSFFDEGEWEVEKKMIDVGDEREVRRGTWGLSRPYTHFENVQ